MMIALLMAQKVHKRRNTSNLLKKDIDLFNYLTSDIIGTYIVGKNFIIGTDHQSITSHFLS